MNDLKKIPTRKIQLPPGLKGLKTVKQIFIISGILLLLALGWNYLLNGELFKTTLNTTFNRLSSTEVKLSIPTPGKLVLAAGPSNFLSGANIFAVVISSTNAITAATSPFVVDNSYTTLLNGKNPDAPDELVLTLSFPEGKFKNNENKIVELPFSTSADGQFEIKSIYFGSATPTVFPPIQEYPIFIMSPTFPYDENGAAKITGTSTTPPPPPKPTCSDTFDNDADGKIDFPADPGCADVNDTDETDPPAPKPLKLDIPAQHLKFIQTQDYRTEIIVIPPSAQEQLQYQFTLKADGGSGQYIFGIRGRVPNTNQAYPLTDSGLILKTNGLITGEPGSLRAANYRYPFFVTDGTEILNFSLQIAVHDSLGNPVGLILNTSFSGTEHRCEVGKTCEAFFIAGKGIAPYLYSFGGEAPVTGTFLQASSGQAFYRFTPTDGQIGVYNATVTVSDSSEAIGTSQTVASSSVPFTLTIVAPPPPAIESTFKFSAEKICDFLDLSVVDPNYSYFQFTCQNGVMEGFQGLVRADDSLNRAEAAKITTLIVGSDAAAREEFKPFANLSAATPVNYGDVTVGDWYSHFIYYLFKQGIIVDKKLYYPADTLNVAEALKLIIEAYAPLNTDLAEDLLGITEYDEWYEPYQKIAGSVDASMSYLRPGFPAKRKWIAELLYKLNRSYPVEKFE